VVEEIGSARLAVGVGRSWGSGGGNGIRYGWNALGTSWSVVLGHVVDSAKGQDRPVSAAKVPGNAHNRREVYDGEGATHDLLHTGPRSSVRVSRAYIARLEDLATTIRASEP